MHRAGRQLESLSFVQGHVAAKLGEMERDRTRGRDEDLVVAVTVRRVRVARAVAPGVRVQSVGGEPSSEVVRAHPIVAPKTVPTVYVIAAAAAPMTTWRVPLN